MRLLTFSKDGTLRTGAEKNGNIVDLSVRMSNASVKELIARDQIGVAEEIVATSPTDYAIEDVSLQLPIADPAKIICVGVNYMNRNAEYKDGSDVPPFPSLFVRTPMSFSPHGQPIVRPPESDQLDYEGEIVLVIGKTGRRIAQDQAMGHIAGLTIMNEGSIRDWLRHGKFNVTQGKNFDRSGGLGPWIETSLSTLDVTDMRIETRVNGELRQSDSTSSMAFPFARIIEYISTFCTLLPGDIIATGTPTGSGGRFTPPKWLVPGDVVEVSVAGVGLLRNTVVDERAE